MKGRLTLQQRLILPIILLGLITLLSNILAVFSINNVHANAATRDMSPKRSRQPISLS